MKTTPVLTTTLCILACLSAACNQFLEDTPRDQIPEDMTSGSPTDIYIRTVATLYNYIGGYEDSQGLQGTYRGIYDLNTFTTDEAIIPTRGGDWYDGGFWQGLFLHDWGTNNYAIQDTWEYLYKVIVLSNQSIEQLNTYQNEYPDTDLTAWTAEVRALRAMYYYHLLDLFGRVPIVLSTSTPINQVIQQPRSQIFHFVTNELLAALPHLNNERSNSPGNYYGRITRPVAHFLLAKIILNCEVYTDDDWTDDMRPDGKNIMFRIGNHDLNAWQAVQAFCDSLDNFGYYLSANYTDNFKTYNENSPENIFTIPMDKYIYTNQMQNLFRSRHYNHAKAYGLGGENGSCATIEALQTFGYDTDSVDSRFDICYYAGLVTDLNGDTVRLDNGTALEYLPWHVRLDLSGMPEEKTAGARMKKYEIDSQATKDGKLSDNDIVLFRYADALLMKSEAKVRNGENGDAELNAVRTRAGMPPRKATLENILAERQLELAWESWRRQDLIRFGLFTRTYNERPTLPQEENNYTTVFPIPVNILSLNPNLSQNPGY